MDGWMDGWMDGRTDGWMDGWTDGWMDKWMDDFMNLLLLYVLQDVVHMCQNVDRLFEQKLLGMPTEVIKLYHRNTHTHTNIQKHCIHAYSLPHTCTYMGHTLVVSHIYTQTYIITQKHCIHAYSHVHTLTHTLCIV